MSFASCGWPSESPHSGLYEDETDAGHRLQQHIDGKHGDKKDKSFKDFFPSFVAA